MGRFLRNFKQRTQKVGENLDKASSNLANKQRDDFAKTKFKNPNSEKVQSTFGDLNDEMNDKDLMNDNFYDDFNKYDSRYDDVLIQPSQKPESFHHFILENQYKDLERSIRGLKDVWDGTKQQWTTKRKEVHCFTDEEAEDILRTAQSHLATDIKLSFINVEHYGQIMNALYKQIAFLFRSIAEYRYGRYGSYEKQYQMKAQNLKIFVELWTRIQANYSRAIKGAENQATHQAVKGQESLQNSERDKTGRNVGYS